MGSRCRFAARADDIELTWTCASSSPPPSSTGHFAPLIPFAQACRDAGHDVLVAGPPDVAELAYRAALPYEPVAAADPERLAEVSRMMAGRVGFERIAIATTELFVGSHARAALPDMLDLVERWQPDVIARETAEVASLVAAEAHGVPDVRVGVALATPYEDWLARDGLRRARRAACGGRRPGRSRRGAGAPRARADPGADGARRAPGRAARVRAPLPRADAALRRPADGLVEGLRGAARAGVLRHGRPDRRPLPRPLPAGHRRAGRRAARGCS